MTIALPVTESLPFKLRIEDFELLDRAGVFAGHKRVELIEGVLVAMNAEFRLHTIAKNELMFRLRLALLALASDYTALVEPTLALPPHNLPEPDVLVTNAPLARDYYRLDFAAIVIEVADTTLADDLGVKCAMYAAHGVPEYWVVALPTGDVHQFWAPSSDGFGERRTVSLEGEVTSATMPELKIDGRGIL